MCNVGSTTVEVVGGQRVVVSLDDVGEGVPAFAVDVIVYDLWLNESLTVTLTADEVDALITALGERMPAR